MNRILSVMLALAMMSTAGIQPVVAESESDSPPTGDVAVTQAADEDSEVSDEYSSVTQTHRGSDEEKDDEYDDLYSKDPLSFNYDDGTISMSSESGGSCGDNVTWSYDSSSYTLTISGTGAMTNYSSIYDVPWCYSTVSNIVIESGVTSIGNYAFYNSTRKYFSEVPIPDTVTSIGAYSFYNCSYLTSVTIPESVTSIGAYAFSGCSGLEYVSVPESVTNIGDSAFRNCSAMTELYIGGAAQMGKYAFYNCRNLESVTFGYAEINIGNYAFESCSALTEIEISGGVKSIGEYAFENLSLKTLNISAEVETIGLRAFYRCSSLSDITLPTTLTSIGQEAFYDTSYYNSSENWDNGMLYIGDYLISGSSASGDISVEAGTLGIADFAFSSNSSITAVTLPEGLKFIGSNAFYYCSYGKSVNIPSTVKTIGYRAFYRFGYNVGSSGFVSLTIPDGVETIGQEAFCYCRYLSSITLPDSLKSVGQNAFSSTAYYNSSDNWTDGLLYIGNVLISGDNLSETSCAIKDGTVLIAEYAFSGNGSVETVVETVTIPDSVKRIGAYAFYNCTALTSAPIPSGIEYIGNYAFSGCSALTAFTVPNAEMGTGVFDNCTGVESITLAEGITSIDSKMFYGLSNLASVTVPSTVTRIGEDAFYGTALYNNTENWKDGVLYIGTYLIKANNEALGSEYAIADTTTYIADAAFSGCTALTGVTIPQTVTTLPANAFYGCSSLKSITIPSGMTTVGSGAFYGCSAAETVMLPKSVTTIEAGAFYGCSGIAYVVYEGTADDFGAISIGKSNSEITNAAIFYSNTTTVSGTCGDAASWSLDAGTRTLTVSGTGTMTKYSSYSEVPWYSYRTCAKTVKIESGIENICKYAFFDSPYLNTVHIPKSVTKINSYAFYKCPSMKYVMYEGSADDWSAIDMGNGNAWMERSLFCRNGSTEISDSCGDDAVWSMDVNTGALTISGKGDMDTYRNTDEVPWLIYSDTISSITIESGITNISDYAFYGCKNVESISIPATVTAVGQYAFYNCYALKSAEVTGNSALKSIGAYAFYGCSALASVTFADGGSLATIGEYAFSGCSALESVANAASQPLTSIGRSAFYNCSALTGFDIPSQLTYLGDFAFANCSALASVSIPSGTTEIRSSAFSGCSALASVSIPQNVTVIGNCAFYGCSALAEITLPTGLSRVGQNAFTNTAYYKDTAKWESNVLYIGSCLIKATTDVMGAYTVKAGTDCIADDAFNGCSKVTSMTLQDGVKNIGRGAFYNCRAMTQMHLPASLETVKSDAFYGCAAFSLVYYAGSEEDWSNVNIDESNEALLSAAVCYNGATEAKGTCGENMTWTMNVNTYAVTVSGTGDMYDFDSSEDVPWSAYKDRIASVTLESGITSIGNYAFSGMSVMTDIAIPDTVTRIGKYAFSSCYGIKSINIPSTVDIVDANAFESCSNLTSVTIPEGVESVGSGAFMNCSSLTTLEIAEGLKSLGSSAFYGCSALDDITLADGIEAIGQSAFDNTAYIKDRNNNWVDTAVYINRYLIKVDTSASGIFSVKGGTEYIADYALSSCSNITAVKLPDTIKRIGNYAFYGCVAMDEINIPDGVAGIGSGAFNNCSALKEMTLPASVTEIGASAFYNCSSITMMTIPDGVTAVSASTFYGCSSLESVTIPDSVTSIDNSAFYGCSSLASVDIPKAVTSVGEYAFYNCSSLKYVSIPKAMEEIGYGAFYYNRYYSDSMSIIAVYYGGSEEDWENISISGDNSPLTSAVRCYDGSHALEGSCGEDASWSMNMDSQTLTISGTGDMTDYSDSSYVPWHSLRSYVKSAVIEEGITSIGDCAFYSCSNMTDVTIPTGVTKIGDSAFYYCSKLSGAVIPEGVESVGYRAFCGCSSLYSVNIPTSITSVGQRAYYNTGYYNTSDNWVDGALYIDSALIEANSSITGEYTVKDGTAVIADYAFYNRDTLTSVTMPEGLKSIGSEAFNSCNILSSVTIPAGVTSLGDGVFRCCQSLETAVIGSGTETIPEHAFNECTSLKTVTIPATVTTVEYGAFGSCSALTSVRYESDADSWSAISISNEDYSWSNYYLAKAVKCYYNAETASGYCGETLTWTMDPATGILTISGTGAIPDYANNTDARPWSYFGSRIKEVVLEDGVTGIGSYAFHDCNSLSAVTAADSVTSIGNYAFDNCAALTAVPPLDTVTSIGVGAFCNCDGIASVTIPGSITTISQAAFYDCDNLEAVIISDGVTAIGYEAFYDCDNLASITIADSVTSIGPNAFYGTAYYNTAENWTDGLLYIGNYLIAANSDVKTAMTIKDGTTCVANYAFSDRSSVSSVSVPTSVKHIGDYAFAWCYGLKTVYYAGTSDEWKAVTIGGNNSYLTNAIICYENADYITGSCGDSLTWKLNAENYVLTINGTGAMYDYRSSSAPWSSYSVSAVVIEDGVTSIGQYAFAYRDSITSVSIADSVTGIGADAFYDCDGITSVTIPGGVTSMGYRAFCDCDGLKTVIISDGATSIGEEAFAYCDGLTSVTIPSSVTDFGSEAFYDCDRLENVTFAAGLAGIGSYAFARCDALASVTIPEGTTAIGDSAFYGCSNLAEISIGSTVTSIGTQAFEGTAYYDTEANRTNGVLYIGNYLINADEATPADVTVKDGTLCIADYAFSQCGTLETLTLPQSVKNVGKGTFSNCSNLWVVYYAGSESEWGGITTGDDNNYFTKAIVCYDGKTYSTGACGDDVTWTLELTNRTLTLSGSGDMYDYDSASSVPWHSFADNVYSIVVSDGITSIAPYAFDSCVNAETASIPATVTTVGTDAFSGCGEIDVTVSEDNGSIKISDDVIYSKDGTKLIELVSDKETFDIPSDVTEIESRAFAGRTSLYDVSIPEGVVRIGTDAFCGSGLDDVDIWGERSALYIDDCLIYAPTYGYLKVESGTRLIAENAFTNACGSVVLPPSLKIINDRAFENSGISSITIPGSVSAIPDEAFRGSEYLCSVTISSGVTSIGEDAFYGCDRLKLVTIPDTVTSISGNPFAYTGMLTIDVDDDNSAYSTADGILYNKDKTKLIACANGYLTSSVGTIPATVTTIGSKAFAGAESVTDIYYEGSSSDWSAITFEDGYLRLSATIHYNSEPTTDTDSGECGAAATWNIVDGVLTVSGVGNMTDYASISATPWYEMRNDITKVVIERGITSIGNYAFSGLSNMIEISVADTVSAIGSNAFWNCITMADITIPEKVTTIGDYAFWNCISLTKVTVPDGVTSLSDSAFRGCTSLETVGISVNTASIGDSAFYGCESLETVYYSGSASQWSAMSIGENNSELTGAEIIYGVEETPAPTTEAPATEIPATEVPATEIPSTEVPATEVPATEAPTTEIPATEIPATEVPATEIPVTEVPATEIPATEVPATETPSTAVPATETPATETPATEAPDVPEKVEIVEADDTKVTIHSPEEIESAVLIIAETNDGVLINVKLVPVSINKGETEVDISDFSSEGGIVKYTLWESMANMSPLCDLFAR